MCTMTINQEFNGIELTFATKPEQVIREALKEAGFRWHSVKKLWYAKNTAARMELAKKLSEDNASSTATTAPSAPTATAERVNKYGVKVGDIFDGSFGYNMTIAEIYMVTKICGTTKVEITEIGKKLVRTETGGSEYFVPVPEEKIGDPIQKMVQANRYSREGGYHIKLNESCSLYPYTGGEIYQNTWD